MNILLLLSIKYFNKPLAAISESGRIGLFVLLFFLFLPVVSVTGYGYYDSKYSDFGLIKAQNQTNRILYLPNNPDGGRIISSNFITDESLGGNFNAVKVTYDKPLPAIVQSGVSSPINLIQTQVSENFDLPKYVKSQPIMPNTQIDQVNLNISINKFALRSYSSGIQNLWFLLPDNTLINVNSNSAEIDELISFAESLYQP